MNENNFQDWPERIYLQCSEDAPTTFRNADLEETYWSPDQQFDFDVPYVRADLVAAAPQPAQASKEAGQPSLDRGEQLDAICDAYEAGVGHGLKRDGLNDGYQYYANKECAYAYTIGYENGEDRSREAAPAQDKHPLEGLHINQGSFDAASNAYEAEYWQAKFEKILLALGGPCTDLSKDANGNYKDMFAFYAHIGWQWRGSERCGALKAQPAAPMTDELIVAAADHRELGGRIALTTTDIDGNKVPTFLAKLFARRLLGSAKTDTDTDSSAPDADCVSQVGNFGDSTQELIVRQIAGMPLPNYAQGCSVCYGSGFDVAGKSCPFGCRPAAQEGSATTGGGE